MPVTMEVLLREMVERHASDLHMHSHTPPQIRVNSRLLALGYPDLTPDECKGLIFSQLTTDEIQEFEQRKELDKSFGIPGFSRFRLNAFYNRGSVCAAVRAIPESIPSFAELGLPEDIMGRICRTQRGLVLITGSTGAGKTTTMASVVKYINAERNCHIVTIEDPIEYIHNNNHCIITQREVGADTHSFGDALKYVLRQDPDVIIIGEMRDLETIQAALNIAETGHLVFATLHTADCVQTINRIIDVFPPSQQAQVRTQLSFVLVGSLSQLLLPRSDGKGRCLATEIMIANLGVRTLIREEKVHQIFSLLQTGQQDGMRTLNQSLYELYRQGKISYQEAVNHVSDQEDFKRFFRAGR